MKQFLPRYRQLKLQTNLAVYYTIFVVLTMGIMIFFGYHQTLQLLQATIDREHAVALARQIAIEIGFFRAPDFAAPDRRCDADGKENDRAITGAE